MTNDDDNFQGYPFNPCLTEAQYKEMEEKVSSTLSALTGELKGSFYPLTGMSKEVQQKLIDDHFLFKEGDRFLQVCFRRVGSVGFSKGKIIIIIIIFPIILGCQRLSFLADRSWYLPQRQQNIFGLVQRGRSPSSYFNATRWRFGSREYFLLLSFLLV